jgi:hypothetical protein
VFVVPPATTVIVPEEIRADTLAGKTLGALHIRPPLAEVFQRGAVVTGLRGRCGFIREEGR